MNGNGIFKYSGGPETKISPDPEIDPGKLTDGTVPRSSTKQGSPVT